MNTTGWTLEDSDRFEDDVLLEEFPDFSIYSVMGETEIIGIGVFKDGHYWVKEVLAIDLSLAECEALSNQLISEAQAFALGLSPNQLSLF
jgi:hypothetical protein